MLLGVVGKPLARLALIWALICGFSFRASGQEEVDNAFDPDTFGISLVSIASGFERPVHVADPGDGSGRLFVVEQPGRIRIVQDGAVLETPFLDLTDRVESGASEQGLLSVAFDPDYAENGRFFVGYTGFGPANVIARFQVSESDPDMADSESEQIVIEVDDPYWNHNGGLVLFGPDGYLYAGFGDGGSGGDPEGNGQNLGTLLGKILRIDVSGDFAEGDAAYRVPEDNPFVGQAGARPEIWAYGLRNPWRFSFDQETGDLYIGDVGQGAREEIDFQPVDSRGGENYGWNVMEGTNCYSESDGCETHGLVLPIAEYGHDMGNAVTGGYVYRGEATSELNGVYLFADFGSGYLWGLGRNEVGEWLTSEPVDTGLNISSFGEDATGVVYATAFDGTLYRVAAP